MNDKPNRRVTVYLVLERPRRWAPKSARVVRHSMTTPVLRSGQCAVKVTIEVPDTAFEPILDIPVALAFAVNDVLRATAEKESR
jgi:hypothetical protein